MNITLKITMCQMPLIRAVEIFFRYQSYLYRNYPQYCGCIALYYSRCLGEKGTCQVVFIGI